MKFKLVKVAKVMSAITLAIASVVIVLTTFLVGYIKGYAFGKNDQALTDQKALSQIVSATMRPVPVASVAPSYYPQPTTYPKVTWGGPQLWEAVNKRRVEFGVNPLKEKDELCTIASIRLNQILELGKLDGHVGFSTVLTDRPDLKYIFDQYNISEFLVSGATSPQNAVDLWENTLGHKKLLSGGEYSWGCIYAQDGFGVAIAAY